MRKKNFTRSIKTLLGASAFALAMAPYVQAACTYTVTNNWGSGFTGEIKVTNDTTQTVNNWSVSWQESGASVTSAWNVTLTGANPYTATPSSWNATLAPKATASFGFQASGSAGAPKVNGSLCGTVASSLGSSKASIPASSLARSSLAPSSMARSSVAPSSKAVSSIAASVKSSANSVPASSSTPSVATFTIQEEQAGFCRVDGIATEITNTGYTGEGYTNTNNAQGAAIEWAVSAPTSSRYTLTFRFANGGTANRNGSLLINGGSNGSYTVNLPATGAWTSWQTASIDIDLVQGNNTLKLAATTADGLANIDSITIEGAQTGAGSCGTTVSSSSASRTPSSAATSSTSSTTTLILSQTGNPVHSRFNSMKSKWGQDKADIVLSYQYTNGGWPKNQTYDTRGSGGSDSGTFDNGATTTEMVYLANVYRDSKNTKYRDSARKALEFTLSAQYSTGGWPQYFPLKGGYADHVTFNDNAMTRVLTVLYHATQKTAPFDTDVFSDDQRSRAKAAITKGVDYVLKAQWKQNGILTAWCAQHGKDDYKPKPARAYELESISGNESAEIIAFLMTQPQTTQVATAVKAALTWYRSPNTYLANYTYDSSLAATNPIVPQAGSKMWYRFYDLNTNRGFFSDRDGSKFYDITQMSLERRTGYSWGGNYGSGIIKYADSVGY
ncbi:MAG: pectate lyase [Pseudomonadota bacterium]